jgi:ketosteroid isomerase-like protein
MMSEDREALVRRGWDAYNGGDLEGTLAIFDPGLVVHVAPPMANAGTYHGHAGFVTWITQWNEAWESFTAAVLAVEPVGERHVVANVHQSGTGRGSGIDVAMESGWVFEVVDGLCTYLSLHQGFEDAREEARGREAGD